MIKILIQILRLFIINIGVFFYIANAQVGIRNNSNALPSGYQFPHPSAALDVLSDSKAVRLPRVNLISLTDNITPIANPKEGLIIYNQNVSPQGGIYSWDTNKYSITPQYNKSYEFLETPKFVSLYLNEDLRILSTQNPGQNFYFLQTQSNPNRDTYLTLDNAYLNDVKIGEWQYGVTNPNYEKIIILPSGSYIVDVNFTFNASSTTTATNRSATLVPYSSTYTASPSTIPTQTINNNYYDMGYYCDLVYGNYPIYSSNLLRSEAHTLSRVNMDHSVSYTYSINLNQTSYITFSIGRVLNSTYYNETTLKKDGSYIKINKIK